MPYKDPERKKQWEREHREKRNARRRRQNLTAQIRAIAPKLTPDSASHQESKGIWKSFAALALGLGVVLLTALAGVPVSGNLGSTKTTDQCKPLIL